MKEDERRLLEALTEDWGTEPHGGGRSTFLETSKNLGIPYKRARSIARNWNDAGFYERGVSWRCGWWRKSPPLPVDDGEKGQRVDQPENEETPA